MLKVDLSLYQNREYRPGGLLPRGLWYIISAMFFETMLLPSSGPKRFLLRLFGAEIGNGVVIKPQVKIKYPWFLSVGERTWIGERVWIDNLAQVTIGPDVCISQGAMLLTGNHDYSKPTFDLSVKSITIGSGAWIGAQSLVCPGVNVATHAVLGAGSVAKSDLEAYTIYAGNPAAAVRKRIIE